MSHNKNIDDIIRVISPIKISGDKHSQINSLEFDSRKVKPGAMFFAIRGTAADGHDFIEKAIELGASTVVCEEIPEGVSNIGEERLANITFLIVENSSIALALAACEFYNNPSHSLKLVGVTGTNGKTTTATLLHSLFTSLGYKAGLISTVINKIGSREEPSRMTTPDPIALNSIMAEMVDSGCDYCFMEVSSHSTVQHRVDGLKFAGGIFTNLTHDHLDYHKTFSEYIKAKKKFFDSLPKDAFALTNIDDKNGEVMLQNCKARLARYSLQKMTDYRCRLKEMHIDGMLLEINDREVWSHYVGRFNAYNLTALYGAAIELGEDSTEVLTALSALKTVPGRFELIRSRDGRLAVVDYAHTPDALENILESLSEVRSEGNIITVVGCGGDRDATKRPVMAKIAANMSERVILTSDNPRSEDPEQIIKEMMGGLDKKGLEITLTITNRREAIRTAAALSKSGDIILIAGKGHETYQEIKGVRDHFDDREEIAKAFGNI